MMWIYDKERLGNASKTYFEDKFMKLQRGASVENIHKISQNHKDHGKTGILKVIEDSRISRLEL